VTRFSTDLDSKSGTPMVYTDDSGLEYQRRITNLTYHADDPVPAITTRFPPLRVSLTRQSQWANG
jgi:hypothetical protein